MRKVLFSTVNLTSGGAEKVLVKILEKLDKKKYDLDLFLIYEEGVYLKNLENYNIFSFYNKKICDFRDKNIFLKKIIGLYIKISRKMLFRIKMIFSLYIKKTYDVEIAFLEGKASGLISNHETKAKKIAWVHTDLEKHRTMAVEEERKIYKNFDKIICVSQASKEAMLKLYPEYKEKVDVIYNPIDKNEIIEKSREKIIDLKRDKLNIITAGRLFPEKGYDLLLQAHKELLKEGLDYNLIILGEGELEKEFKEYIAKNDISENTKLLGFKYNPYPYIAQGDIFIMSSRYEGYPLVLCEALILKKPIIATKCTGPAEILDEGKYGMLIPTEDIEALKHSIKKMVESEELRKKYSELSKERSKIFNMDSVMNKIEGLLNEK